MAPIHRDPFDVAGSSGGSNNARRIRPVSGTVSVHQLAHRIPKKAKREFIKAVNANRDGNRASAIEHLRKAVEIDPEFAIARNDLGAMYLVQGNTDLALKQLNAAIGVDPHSPMPYTNLAVAYTLENNAAAAEAAARQSLNLDHTELRARLMLGMSLVMQNKFSKEAEQSLLQVEQQFPEASLLLARLFAGTGRIGSAKERLQRYLQSARRDDDAAELAKNWMKILNNGAAKEASLARQQR